MSNRCEFNATVQMTERELDALRRIVQGSTVSKGVLFQSEDPVTGDQSPPTRDEVKLRHSITCSQFGANKT